MSAYPRAGPGAFVAIVMVRRRLRLADDHEAPV
jgi:hypothetical protein